MHRFRCDIFAFLISQNAQDESDRLNTTTSHSRILLMRYLHTMVRVSDLDASLDFYCNKLGLKEVRRMENEKGRFTLVFLATPDDAKRIKEEAQTELAAES